MISAGPAHSHYSGEMDGNGTMTLDEPVWQTVVGGVCVYVCVYDDGLG